MGTNYALPTAQFASVLSLVTFLIWSCLGSQTITAIQNYFINGFSFESETNTTLTIENEGSNQTLQNLLIPVAETMANNLQNTLQYKIQHWFNFITLIFLIIKTIGTICCCQYNKKIQTSLSVITTITGFTSLIIFTNFRVPAYFEKSTVWLYVIAWISIASQILSGIAGVLLKPSGEIESYA